MAPLKRQTEQEIIDLDPNPPWIEYLSNLEALQGGLNGETGQKIFDIDAGRRTGYLEDFLLHVYKPNRPNGCDRKEGAVSLTMDRQPLAEAYPEDRMKLEHQQPFARHREKDHLQSLPWTCGMSEDTCTEAFNHSPQTPLHLWPEMRRNLNTIGMYRKLKSEKSSSFLGSNRANFYGPEGRGLSFASNFQLKSSNVPPWTSGITEGTLTKAFDLSPPMPLPLCLGMRRSLNSIGKCKKLERKQSSSFMDKSSAKFCRPEVHGLSFVDNVQLESKLVNVEGFAIECGQEDVQAPPSLFLSGSKPSEPIFGEHTCPSSHKSIREGHDLRTSIESADEKLMVEGKSAQKSLKRSDSKSYNVESDRVVVGKVQCNVETLSLKQVAGGGKHDKEFRPSLPCDEESKVISHDQGSLQMPPVPCQILIAPVNSIAEIMKQKNYPSGNLSTANNPKFSETTFQGREMAAEIQQTIGPVCSEDIVDHGEQKKVQLKLTSFKAEIQLNEDKAEVEKMDELNDFCRRMNKEMSGQMECTCQTCSSNDKENLKQELLLRRMDIGAKELPVCNLSHHIEQRLMSRLGEERQERAKALGMNINQVPTAKGLVVRVASSIDKIFEVKPRFCQIFQKDNYPSEFAYKSKAILLFQAIEDADVLLFVMYVQEYGADCSYQNKRRIYISYVDSVKYFRPKIKAVTGEALRTFVYHEVLIGYLDCCKKRWFTSCHIWVCPPLKNDEYILHCHPKDQKIPKSDKLREWYRKLIRKASDERIVVEDTNLYDHFFIHTHKSKAKITAARLPYFDGDFLPEEIDWLLINSSENCPPKKRKKSEEVRQRTLRAARREASSVANEKDLFLMKDLVDIIAPKKEDFIVLHLHHICKYCCQPLIYGQLWVCNICPNYHLCTRCHDFEENLHDKDRHPVNQRGKHSFYKVEIEGAQRDTIDEDGTRSCKILNTRLDFLDFCQHNHYKFDTLHHAKNSTIMILNHLKNSEPPALTSPWCDEMDCKHGQHSLGLSSGHRRDSSNREEHDAHYNWLIRTSQQRLEISVLVDVLLHASKCFDHACIRQFCRNLKALFHHGVTCGIRKKGGCDFCIKMWDIVCMHARSCTELECCVPRCKDLKKRFGLIGDASNRFATNKGSGWRTNKISVGCI